MHAFHLPPSATDLNPKSLSPPKQSKNLEKWSVADSGRRHDPIPYIRKTPRRNPRHLITLDQLTTTNWQVVDKMDQLGLCDELEEGEVYLVSTTSDAYCWYQGHIHIPAISEANLSDYFTGHQNRLTNELRHEWAYVLADAYPEWIKTRQFNSVFGGR